MNPSLKLIFIRRDPKERAWSHALMELARQGRVYEATPDSWFEKHFQSECSRRRCEYAAGLEQWCSVFPDQQLLVLDYEHIVREPRALLQRCATHIGVDPAFFNAAPDVLLHERIFSGESYPWRPSLQRCLERMYG